MPPIAPASQRRNGRHFFGSAERAAEVQHQRSFRPLLPGGIPTHLTPRVGTGR